MALSAECVHNGMRCDLRSSVTWMEQFEASLPGQE